MSVLQPIGNALSSRGKVADALRRHAHLEPHSLLSLIAAMAAGAALLFVPAAILRALVVRGFAFALIFATLAAIVAGLAMAANMFIGGKWNLGRWPICCVVGAAIVGFVGNLALTSTAALHFDIRLKAAHDIENTRPGFVIVDQAGDVGHAVKMENGEFTDTVIGEPVPPVITNAIHAIEDSRPERLTCIDLIGISRAAAHDLEGKREGGSPLSEQWARWELSIQRTGSLSERVPNKLQAMAAGVRACDLFPDIESEYINDVPVGDIGPHHLRGLAAAALALWHTRLRNVSLAEAVVIASLPQNPDRFLPVRRPREADASFSTRVAGLRRRSTNALLRMEKLGMISGPERATAKEQLDQVLASPSWESALAWLNTGLDEKLPAILRAVYDQVPECSSHLLRVQITIDQQVNHLATATASQFLQQIGPPLGSSDQDPLLLDAVIAQGGAVRAWIGDPWLLGGCASLVKIFTYSVAFEQGTITPTSPLGPQHMPAYQALGKSNKDATIALAENMPVTAIADKMREAGWHVATATPKLPVFGSGCLTSPILAASTIGAFGWDHPGLTVETRGWSSITAEDGTLLAAPARHRLFSTNAAIATRRGLVFATTGGTAKHAMEKVPQMVACKTGTNDVKHQERGVGVWAVCVDSTGVTVSSRLRFRSGRPVPRDAGATVAKFDARVFQAMHSKGGPR